MSYYVQLQIVKKVRTPSSPVATEAHPVAQDHDIGMLDACLSVCFWPILLKKSIMVSTAEKYASEIEIFTFGRGFQTQISRSSVQKWRSH
ncbi:hypothetical protein [Pseudomonas fluorescens]|uniref:hypothetical protein n=1 Tax=Pseudomonas fluorescens TaxID=294 RepID=UPI0007321DC0|nr:hypothetical protein [Pseudomonas fluorescens]